MPELPEVETVVRGLRPVLVGRCFTRVEARRSDLRWPLPPDLTERLTGARVTEVARRGKYGLVHTDRDCVMLFHLGMSGRLRVDPPEVGAHDHIIFETDAGRRIAFHDARRFGSLELVASGDVGCHHGLAALGPEPFGQEFTPSYVADLFRARTAPVKALLLDQRTVAGLGNIYVSEALHAAGIHPSRRAGSLNEVEAGALVGAVRAVLEAAIAAGGSSFRDHVQVDGELGVFQHQWRVYGREDENCRQCGGRIARIVQAGRSTFLCPTCQA